jgi:hypothetical protein
MHLAVYDFRVEASQMIFTFPIQCAVRVKRHGIAFRRDEMVDRAMRIGLHQFSQGSSAVDQFLNIVRDS